MRQINNLIDEGFTCSNTHASSGEPVTNTLSIAQETNPLIIKALSSGNSGNVYGAEGVYTNNIRRTSEQAAELNS